MLTAKEKPTKAATAAPFFQPAAFKATASAPDEEEDEDELEELEPEEAAEEEPEALAEEVLDEAMDIMSDMVELMWELPDMAEAAPEVREPAPEVAELRAVAAPAGAELAAPPRAPVTLLIASETAKLIALTPIVILVCLSLYENGF